MPGERNRPRESDRVPHPSTKHAINDESQQSDLPSNNVGRIAPLTEEPTPTGPSSVNDYRKFVKYAWMMALLLVIVMAILLMINHKTFDHYPNLVELQSNLSVKCVGFILTLMCMAVGGKSSIWDALTNRASTVQKQKFDQYFSKNTPTTNSFFCGTYEILQVYRVTETKKSLNAGPIVPTEPPAEKSTSTINDNLEQQSESLHNDSTTYEDDESNETRIGIPGLSEQVPTPNRSESSIYDEKQKFYKHIAKSVPTISVSFITVSLVFLYSSMQIGKHNLVRKILTCIGWLICLIGLFLAMHNWIKKPSPRTSKTQFIFMVFGVLLIVLFVVIAAVLIVSPDSLLEGAVWVVIMIIIIGLLGAFLVFTARQTEDNRQN